MTEKTGQTKYKIESDDPKDNRLFEGYSIEGAFLDKHLMDSPNFIKLNEGVYYNRLEGTLIYTYKRTGEIILVGPGQNRTVSKLNRILQEKYSNSKSISLSIPRLVEQEMEISNFHYSLNKNPLKDSPMGGRLREYTEDIILKKLIYKTHLEKTDLKGYEYLRNIPKKI